MLPDEFYQSRKEKWQTLESLLGSYADALQRHSIGDIQRLGRLYREVSSDLAIAQRDYPNQRFTIYLNNLVARSHALIYRSQPPVGRRVRRFFTHEFPRAFREMFPHFALAALLLLLPALLAGVALAWQPAAARWLLPESAHKLIPTIEQQKLWTAIPIQDRPYTASFIMQNNIRVAFLAFCSGILAGLPTVWIMIVNGLSLGGLLGLTFHYGTGFELFTFVIGHGVVELSVICMAGGMGLALGWAILHPGLLRRKDALILASLRAVRLILGCVPLLVIAGSIEGFISPNEQIAWPLKWATGLVSGALLYGYLFFTGRGKEEG